MKLEVDATGSKVSIAPLDVFEREQRAMWGTTRAMIQNHVTGVSEGHVAILRLVGVGYRASVEQEGKIVNLKVQYAHPVELPVPVGVRASTPQPTRILLEGADKEVVKQFAADIRAWRKPEPYKGKVCAASEGGGGAGADVPRATTGYLCQRRDHQAQDAQDQIDAEMALGAMCGGVAGFCTISIELSADGTGFSIILEVRLGIGDRGTRSQSTPLELMKTHTLVRKNRQSYRCVHGRMQPTANWLAMIVESSSMIENPVPSADSSIDIVQKPATPPHIAPSAISASI